MRKEVIDFKEGRAVMMGTAHIHRYFGEQRLTHS